MWALPPLNLPAFDLMWKCVIERRLSTAELGREAWVILYNLHPRIYFLVGWAVGWSGAPVDVQPKYRAVPLLVVEFDSI